MSQSRHEEKDPGGQRVSHFLSDSYFSMAIVYKAHSALPLTLAEAVSFRAELEKGPDDALARDILRTLSERDADWGVVHKSKIGVTVKLLRTSKDKVVGSLPQESPSSGKLWSSSSKRSCRRRRTRMRRGVFMRMRRRR